MFENIIGQEAIKNNITTNILFAKGTPGAIIPHILFIGPAGYGKTLLATSIAKAFDKPYVSGYGPSITSEEQLVKMFLYQDKLIPEGTILIIDEIHAVKANLLEKIYTIMESFSLPVGSTTIQFPKFTLIAGTTDPQYLTKSMRDRFKLTYVLSKYTEKDIADLVRLKIGPGITIDDDVCKKIYEFTAGTPRKVINLAYNLRVYLFVHPSNNNHVDMDTFDTYLKYQGLTKEGFTAQECEYLNLLREHQKLSVNSLTAMLGINVGVILYIVEPSLLERGLIRIVSGGRVLTEKGQALLSNT